MKKIIIVLNLVLILILCGCGRESETSVIDNGNGFLEIISTQEIKVEGYQGETIIIKCQDKENGNTVYIMQGYRKGGISVIKNNE